MKNISVPNVFGQDQGEESQHILLYYMVSLLDFDCSKSTATEDLQPNNDIMIVKANE